MATVLLTGLAVRLSAIIINLTGGALLPVLVFCMIACIFLGGAVPTSIAYILVAILVAPAIVKMGVPPLVYHLFVFYSSLMAMVTPPIGLAAYAAAALAKSKITSTCVAACMLSFAAYIVPYGFVLDPSLVMMGSPTEVLIALLGGIIAVTLRASALAGPISGPMELAKRASAALGAVLLLAPSYSLNLAGLIFGVLSLGPRQMLIWGWRSLSFVLRRSTRD